MNISILSSQTGRYKGIFYQFTSILAGLFLLVACVNHIDDDTPLSGQTYSLQVTTRAAEIAVPYPVRLYAFDTTGKQATTVIVNSANDKCLLMLAEGNYHLVALAGTEGCNLPTNSEKGSNITLPESNYSTTALMMGSADITINNADKEVSMMLVYCMARIELSLSDIPTTATAVKVSFSPLYNAMNFERVYTSEGSRATIACTPKDNLWNTPVFYTFPSIGQSLTFTIEITEKEGTKSYGYIHNGKFEAGTPYILSGSYKQGFSVNGKITAEGWGSTEKIDFMFGNGSSGESGSTGGETPEPGGNDTYTVTAIPSPVTLWNGHAVVAVQNATATTADLLLLSLKEWKDVASANSDEKPTEAVTFAAAYNEGGISGWKIPTKDEAELIKNNCKGLIPINTFNDLLTEAGGDFLTGNGNDSHGDPARYLCENATYTFDLKTTLSSNQPAGGTRLYYLRTVKTVHVVTAINERSQTSHR